MSDTKRFEGMLSRYFEGALADNPIWANYTGLKDGEGKLGCATARHVELEERRRQKALTELDSINPRELSGEQHLDRLALRAMLRRGQEDFTRGRHTLDPNALDTVLGVMLHELQRGDDEPTRAVRNLRSLLREAPRFLEESATLIDRPERVWRKIMEQTAAGADSLFTAVDVFLSKNHSQPKDAVLVASAKLAFTRYHDAVLNRPIASTGSFAIGHLALQRRVHDELGLDYTLGQVEALALAEIRRIGTLLEKACPKFGRKRTPEQIIAKARKEWDPGEDLLATYRAETARVAGAFRAARAVSFPIGDELEVRRVPEFMRHLFPTAAYSSPGAFEKRQRGIFWVNDLAPTKETKEERLAERQQHFGLSLTAAHEAYPGHHLQFVTANRHSRKWRRLFAHAVFYEGWTLWCEQMMVDLRVDRSPWLRVQQLHDALWRAHRIVVDLRLQTGRYSYEQGVRHMMKHLAFTKARAEGDVNWYTGSPGVPMSYWLGRLENERLCRRLMEGRGWSLRRFNDWLLSFGTLPQSWLEKYGLD